MKESRGSRCWGLAGDKETVAVDESPRRAPFHLAPIPCNMTETTPKPSQSVTHSDPVVYFLIFEGQSGPQGAAGCVMINQILVGEWPT